MPPKRSQQEISEERKRLRKELAEERKRARTSPIYLAVLEEAARLQEEARRQASNQQNANDAGSECVFQLSDLARQNGTTTMQQPRGASTLSRPARPKHRCYGENGADTPPCPSDLYTEAELQSMNNNNEFVIPSKASLQEIKRKAIEEMASASEETKPCCVCELNWPVSDIKEQEVTEEVVKHLRCCASVPQAANIPEFIIDQYSAAAIDPRLKGLMLYPQAIRNCGRVTIASICKSCHKHILKEGRSGPPRMAISNGNYVGRLPARFDSLTRTDEQAIALVLPCVSLSIVTGGTCRTIKSHHYVVRNTDGPIIEMLPRDLASRVRVTMVGSMTPTQTAICKKRYELNMPLCKQALRFLDENNIEYRRRQDPQLLPVVRAGEAATTVLIDKSIPASDNSSEDPVVESIRDDSTYSNLGSRVDEGDGEKDNETRWIAASSLIAQRQQLGYTDVLVRKSNVYMPLRTWSVSVKMFPTLFPGGCGGPTEVRDKRISVRSWILRCLRIHGHHFEKHYAFMLLAFDYLASQHARETLYIKMNVRHQAWRAANISHSVVQEAVAYFKHMSACRERGCNPRPPSLDVQHVIDLRKGLRVPESAYFGSNLGRMRARHDLFGIMKRYGPLQLFFTISPDSAGTYNISVKAGILSRDAIDKSNLLLMPNRAERKAIATMHPVECAQYFLRVMSVVIEVLLGWDIKESAPKRSGGIFGVVRAFGAAAETQRAGDLHAHVAVWLYGFPSTSLSYAEMMSRPEFRHRLVRLTEAVLSTKPPCLEDETTCTKCHLQGTLQPVVPGVDAFRRPPVGSTAPVTATCSACGTKFRDRDIIDASINKLADTLHYQMTAQQIDYDKCRPPQVTNPKSSLVSSLLVRDVQTHFWNHTKSCFKKTVRTPQGLVCRFLKPEAVHEGSNVVKDNLELTLHRPIGCEYVNAYSSIVMDTIKCNHDAQFVMCSGAKDAAAYVAKYCFKNQNHVENQAALSLAAFANAVRKTNALPPDTTAIERGYRMLGSMLYSVTNGQEIAAPMAALYILNETPFWFSHKFTRVNMGKLLQREPESVEISISQQDCINDKLSSKRTVSQDSVLDRYWKRDATLERVAFIEICEHYEYAGKSVDPALGVERAKYCKTNAANIFVLSGRELPDISSHHETSDLDYYYTLVLSLFKPHRRSTLTEPNEAPLAAYQKFIQCSDDIHIQQLKQFENQWQDFYRCQQASTDEKESPEEILLRTRAPPPSSWSPGCDDGEDIRDDYVDNTIPDDFEEHFVDSDHSTSRLIENATAIVDAVPALSVAMRGAADHYNTQDNIELDEHFTSLSYDSRIISAAEDIGDDDCAGTDLFLRQYRSTPTRISQLDECFGPVPYQMTDSPRWTPWSLPPFPKIAMVSEAFGLNFWQHVAFEQAARHLLYAYAEDISGAVDDPEFTVQFQRTPYDIKSQFISYLGGEAGTGKSTVVDALLTFSRMWKRVGSVETLAFTGVAAINIKGKTLHSARNLKLNGAEPTSAPTTDMKSRFSRVVLVIIDEISITDQGLLGSTDAVSRSMSSEPTKFMGGKHVQLIGDFFQLPPVGGSPCFAVPPCEANRLRHAGYALYCAINSVVFLTQNMRARFDPVYTSILDDLRWGRLSDEQIQILNTRVRTCADYREVPTHRNTNYYRPVVVCLNTLRCAVNYHMIFDISNARGLPVYECLALPSSRSKKIAENLANVNDNLTDRIPMRLLFFIGMPVMISRKHSALLKADVIANGVLATIVGTYPPPETLTTTKYAVNDITIHRFVQRPELLLLKIHSCTKILVDGFPEGVIGLPPLKSQLRLARMPNLSQASITVEQFAAVPAFACTTEKLQGQTCHDGIVVTPLDRRQRAVPHQTLYVALSRAISLAGLTLTEPLTRVYLDKFKPTEATVNEMQRLIQLVAVPTYINHNEEQAFRAWKDKQHI